MAADVRQWISRRKGKKEKRTFDPGATILGEAPPAAAQPQASGAAESGVSGAGSDANASSSDEGGDYAAAHFFEPPGDSVPQQSLG